MCRSDSSSGATDASSSAQSTAADLRARAAELKEKAAPRVEHARDTARSYADEAAPKVQDAKDTFVEEVVPKLASALATVLAGAAATKAAASEAADRALEAPAADEDAAFEVAALAAMYDATGGYPYFIQAYGKEVWDLAPASPITAEDVRVGSPEAEAELAVGFFGSRYERATPGEREYLRAMADVALAISEGGVEELDDIESVPTSEVAAHLGRKTQSLSPARDALLKKGLIYSGERGRIAFTVPHFGAYLREHA